MPYIPGFWQRAVEHLMAATEYPRAPLVLVVEDRPNIRYLLEVALAQEGLRVVSAATADMGLASAVAQAPDIVLLDLLLPGGRGDALVAALRLLPSGHRLPIIVLSGIEGGLAASQAAGAQDFLAKPFDLRELIARIRYQLGEAAASRSTA